MEAEHIASGEAAKEPVYFTWLKHFLCDGFGTLPVYTDSGLHLLDI
jgi:hypothetical protein